MDAERRFTAMFERTYAPVRRYAHYRGLTGHDADDLVADVFTVAWRKLGAVPEDDPLPWLLNVARNHWRNHVRAARRRRNVIARLPVPHDVAEPDIGGVSIADIRVALERLAPADQEILKLVAWDGLEPHRAARVLGCSPASARVRLHRARTRLAGLLETARGLETHPQKREVDDVRTDR